MESGLESENGGLIEQVMHRWALADYAFVNIRIYPLYCEDVYRGGAERVYMLQIPEYTLNTLDDGACEKLILVVQLPGKPFL